MLYMSFNYLHYQTRHVEMNQNQIDKGYHTFIS